MTTDTTRRGDQPLSGDWPSRTTGETPSPLSDPIGPLLSRILALERRCFLLECALREASGHDIARIQELEQRLNRVHHP